MQYTHSPNKVSGRVFWGIDLSISLGVMGNPTPLFFALSQGIRLSVRPEGGVLMRMILALAVRHASWILWPAAGAGVRVRRSGLLNTLTLILRHSRSA